MSDHQKMLALKKPIFLICIEKFMFIYIEIVKTEYYQREKMKIKKKQLTDNDKNINNEKRK